MTDRVVIHSHPQEKNNSLNCSWYYRKDEFSQRVIDEQIEWKQRHHPNVALGENTDQKGHYYPHIFPERLWEYNVFPEIVEEVKEYVTRNKIQLHKQKNNLLSSQICCFNFLFILRRDLDKAVQVLRPFLPEVVTITAIEFEDTGPAGITEWLGEPPDGRRGQYRTSADVSISWINNQGKRIKTYIEWKFTEDTFGCCGGYTTKHNRNTDRCETLDCVNHPEQLCHIASRRSPNLQRRYWSLLQEDAIGPYERIITLSRGCPFRGPLSQLMRLSLLAEFTRQNAAFDKVEVKVIHFTHNRDLFRIPDYLSHDSFTEILQLWNSALHPEKEISSLSIESLLQAYDADPDRGFEAWRHYLHQRYNI